MSNWTRFLIAGTGAIIPLLLNLTVIDLRTILLGVTSLVLISYVIRQVALFAIGGMVGVLNNEQDPFKLFQIGIAAPALITALLNGSQVRLPQANTQASPSKTAESRHMGWDLVSPAYAQEAARERLKTFSLPSETAGQQVYRGLFGSVPTNVWYVIAGSFANRENAEQRAGEIRQKGFPADVYAPYGQNQFYSVVIGAQLTREEAQQLRLKAISAGLPPDTSIWTFPKEN